MDMKQRGLEREASDQRAAAPLIPPVDIIEDGEGITVRADLPGVSRENLSIGVDGDTLTVEATVTLGEAANVQPVYAEVRTAQYKRSFVLSRDLDTEKINASIRNGVLTLQVPKREQAKPRRIEIKAD
jgi:HSP20 family protein